MSMAGMMSKDSVSAAAAGPRGPAGFLLPGTILSFEFAERHQVPGEMSRSSLSHPGNELGVPGQKIILEFFFQSPECLGGASHRLEQGHRNFNTFGHQKPSRR